ncbi:MAG: recombinase family protein [Armatimonadota bacterium]
MRKQKQQQPRDPSQPLRAVALIRMSTEGQQNSPDRQRAAFANWCEHYALTRIGEYEDLGVSATKTKMTERPGIMKMWADAAENKFDVVWAEETSRASRNMVETLQLMEYLQTMHIPFVDGREDPRTVYDPIMRQIVTAVKAGMAQGETQRLSARVRDTLNQRALRGEYCGGRIPIGYQWTKEEGFAVDHDRVATAVRVFQIFQQCKAYRGTARRLNAEGLVGKLGKPFSQSAVCKILTNPVYRGRILWGGETYPIEAPAIIDPALMVDIEATLLNISRRPQRATKADSVFAGLVHCPECDNWMSSNQESRNKARALRCNKAYREPRHCTNTHVTSERVLERVLLPRIVDELRGRADAVELGTQPKKVALEIETKLARLVEKRNREKLMFSNQLRTWDELQTVLAEIDEIEADLRSQQVEAPTVTPAALRKMARKVETTWSQQDATGKRTLLQTMVSHIVINYDDYGASRIVWLSGR